MDKSSVNEVGIVEDGLAVRYREMLVRKADLERSIASLYQYARENNGKFNAQRVADAVGVKLNTVHKWVERGKKGS